MRDDISGRAEAGQTLAEYAVTLTVITVLVAAAFVTVGDTAAERISYIGSMIAGLL